MEVYIDIGSGDKIEVTGFYGQLPLMRFVGRNSLVSDWFGEKLNERHIERVIAEIFETAPDFALLALEQRAKAPLCSLVAVSMVKSCVEMLEKLLCANHHYETCRKLGQLEGAEICQIDL